MPPVKPKTELYVGIFVFCGLLLLGGLILKFGDFRYAFRTKYPLVLVFKDAGNLTEGAPVRRGGVEIGRVAKDPTLGEGISHVTVPLSIYQEFMIAGGSEFSLKTDGIIGDTFIEVTPPLEATGEMLASGTQVDGSQGNDISAAASQVAEKLVVVMEEVRTSLRELNLAIGKISGGVLAEENLKNLRESLRGFNSTLDKFNKDVLSEKNTKELAATLESIHASSEKLSTNLDKLGVTLASANDVINKKLGPGLDEFSKAGTSLRKSADGLGLVAIDMRNAPGLITALLKDPKLKADFAAAISNLRRHGLLWYKDDAHKYQNMSPVPRGR